MQKQEDFLQAQKTVLGKAEGLLLFILLTPAFAWAFIYITGIPGQSLESWLYSARPAAKLFVLLASPLMALIIANQAYALKHYELRIHHAKSGGFAAGAFLAGAVAAACCTPLLGGILAAVGFAGASIFISQYETPTLLLSLAILAYALYQSSKLVFCSECRVKLKAIKRR